MLPPHHYALQRQSNANELYFLIRFHTLRCARRFWSYHLSFIICDNVTSVRSTYLIPFIFSPPSIYTGQSCSSGGPSPFLQKRKHYIPELHLLYVRLQQKEQTRARRSHQSGYAQLRSGNRVSKFGRTNQSDHNYAVTVSPLLFSSQDLVFRFVFYLLSFSFYLLWPFCRRASPHVVRSQFGSGIACSGLICTFAAGLGDAEAALAFKVFRKGIFFRRILIN